MKNPRQTLSSTIVHQNPWWRVRHDRIVRPDGSEGDFYILEKRPGVIIIPKLGKDQHLMIRLYRHALTGYSLEFPAGSKEDAQKDVLAAAQAELEEETGFRAQKWVNLGEFAADPGHARHQGTVFLAEGLTTGSPRREAGELDMENQIFSGAEIDKMIAKGEIVDSWTIVAWAKYRLGEK